MFFIDGSKNNRRDYKKNRMLSRQFRYLGVERLNRIERIGKNLHNLLGSRRFLGHKLLSRFFFKQLLNRNLFNLLTQIKKCCFV